MKRSLLSIKQYSVQSAFAFCFILLCNYSFAQDIAPVATPSFSSQGDLIQIADPTDQRVVIPIGNAKDNSGDNLLSPPPVNDTYCSGLNAANTLTANAPCKTGTVAAATTQAGETSGCATTCGSVWYSFTATQANMFITLHPTNSVSTATCAFSIVVYPVTAALVASCPAGSSIPSGNVGCHQGGSWGPTWNTLGSEFFSNLNLAGLVVGNTYLVQVMQGSCACGAATKPFCIALGTPHNCATCASTCGPICGWNLPNPGPTVNQVIATCPIYPQMPPLNTGDSHTDCYVFTAPNTYFNVWGIVDSWGGCAGTDVTNTFQVYNTNCVGGVIGSGSAFGGYSCCYIAGHQYTICYTHQAACPQDTLWPYVWAASSLPIELLSFDAKSNKHDIDVYWTTASEMNTSEFVIERTYNGQDFVEIGRLKAAGNSTSILNYKIKDLKPLVGNNYYRLKEIDIDGKISSDKLVLAQFSNAENGLVVVPNPANDLINIQFSSDKDVHVLVNIIDTKGSIVLSENIITNSDGVNLLNMSLSNLPKGVYCAQIISNEQYMNTRFIKE